MGKNKNKGDKKNSKKACYVFGRPNKKNKWGVYNRITKNAFIFKKKRHAYLVAKCLNEIYKLELVDIPQKNE